MSAARRAAIAALVLATGCSIVPGVPHRRPIPAYFADAADVKSVRRIMVLPFQAAPGVQAETGMLRSAFLAELNKIQRFEIVPLEPGTDKDQSVYESLRHGRISTETLAWLGERYDVDGVLLATVTHYRPYKPPSYGLRVQLLSLHTATAVWASEALYDAADADTVSDVRHYSSSFRASNGSLHGWELILLAPEQFASFVAHRIVGTWRDAGF